MGDLIPLAPLGRETGSTGRPIATLDELRELRNFGDLGMHRIVFQANLSFIGHEKMGIYIAQALERYMDTMLKHDAAEAAWDDIWMRYDNVDDEYMDLAGQMSDSCQGVVVVTTAVAKNHVGDPLEPSV
jgi:hypothetical protein